MNWTTQKRKVSDLKVFDANPRQMSKPMYEKLKSSIQKFGYVELVAIDTDNTIIAGHMRIRALVELGRGEEEIEVRMPERKLTKQEFDIYLNSSNKIKGQFDFEMLANHFDNADLIESGFTPYELGLDSFEPTEAKDIVFSFLSEEYKNIVERLNAIKEETKTETNSELFKIMLDFYEQRSR